jgi:hypothetical protein
MNDLYKAKCVNCGRIFKTTFPIPYLCDKCKDAGVTPDDIENEINVIEGVVSSSDIDYADYGNYIPAWEDDDESGHSNIAASGYGYDPRDSQ